MGQTFGKQESVVSALSYLYFERGESVSKRTTLLKAAEQVSLDAKALEQILHGDAFQADVWSSYRKNGEKIHRIPLFIFNGPGTNGGHR